jgi:hypothetical protein
MAMPNEERIDENELMNEVEKDFAGTETEARVSGMLPGKATFRVINVYLSRSKGATGRKQLCAVGECL